MKSYSNRTIFSRNEDPNNAPNQRSSFSTKTELFRKQIQDTVGFGKHVAGADADSVFTKSISTFNPGLLESFIY